MEIQVLPYPEAPSLPPIPEAVLGLGLEETVASASNASVVEPAPPDGRLGHEEIGETPPPVSAIDEAPQRASKPKAKAKPRAKAKAKEAPREDAPNSSKASDRAPETEEVEEIAKVEEPPKPSPSEGRLEAPEQKGKGRGRPAGL